MKFQSLFHSVALIAASLVGSAAAAATVSATGNAAADTAAIQTAINSGEDVVLGEGTFAINATLDVKNGVTLQGQGWEKTIIKAASGANIRCVKVTGGSRLIGVTVTGGNVASRGAGVHVEDGTVSWCCISNNTYTSGNNYSGGGVSILKGTIDHCIVAYNTLAAVGWGGGIGGGTNTGGLTDSVLIDTCLIYGNRNTGGSGAGVGFERPNKPVTIRNCTITGNSCTKYNTGGIYFYNNSATPLYLVNNIVSGNTLNGAENNLKVHSVYKTEFKNCLFGFAEEASGCVASLSGDPAFVDAANGNYRLGDVSPAVGKGMVYTGIGTDLDGNAFAAEPSIGCYELASASAMVAPPVFDPQDGFVFYPSTEVTLSCATDGATIRYTTDGNDPTETSAVYEGAIPVTATTTIKAQAFKAGMEPSRVSSATYTYEDPVPPTLGEISVAPRATIATFSGSVTSLGNFGATACDVYLAVGPSADAPGEAVKVVSGATASFTFVQTGLESETTYFYTLSASNNASVVSGAATSGSFTTTNGSDDIDPVEGDPTLTRQLIQGAIDAAAAQATDDVPAGTVTLGSGLFEIDAELMVTGGVTVVGQNWTNTVVKQTASGVRVVTLSDGSTIEGVTLTGGKLVGNWSSGACALVNDGSISGCCISNNTASGNNIYGGAIRIYKGQIDHSVIAFNKAGVTGTGFGGAVAYYMGGFADKMGSVTIDTCLFYGNTANSDGGAIYNSGAFTHDNMLSIRNTTIADNDAGGNGGGIYSSRAQLTLVNSLLADNTAANGANYSISDGVLATVAEQARGCFFGNGYTVLGTNSTAAIEADFKDADNGDYRLKAVSSAVEAGIWYEDIADDLDGVARTSPKMAAGCYECTEIDRGAVRLGEIAVEATTATAVLTGTITDLGEGTTATVTLCYGLSAEALTETQSVTDVEANEEFSFELEELTHATHYFYTVTAENDADRSTTVAGDFFTQYDPEARLIPAESPAQNVSALTAAFTAAAAEQGTVNLGEGVFEINDELIIGNGITVVGQGADKTVIKQTAGGKRVMTLKDGARLEGILVTGGETTAQWTHGGGVLVENGTVSRCCISNNAVKANNSYGGGVCFKQGAIDHSVIVDNTCGGSGKGAGIGGYSFTGAVTIDTCLIRGNNVTGGGNGGGVGIEILAPQPLTIRNSTIVGNVTSKDGGAMAVGSDHGSMLEVLNCIFAGNTSGSGTDVKVHHAGSFDYCLFDKADNVTVETEGESLGEHCVVGDPGFTNAGNGNYHLSPSSSAIGVGLWYEDITEDLDGARRSRRIDAGCYKSHTGTIIILK